MLNHNLKTHTLKMNNILGWSLLCEENGNLFLFFFPNFPFKLTFFSIKKVNLMAINIPEEDRWISILELNENSTLLE